MKAFKNIALALSLFTVANTSFAKEGPEQSVPGAEGFLAGALPPAGSYFINYLGNYNGSLHNQNGEELRMNGQNANVNATFNVLRFVHVTDKKVLGADWGYQLVVPVVSQTMDIFGQNSHDWGVGDITVTPVVLGWHPSKNFHILAAVDFFLPTGRWSASTPAKQIGANYFSIEPVIGMSYLADNGFEASTKLMYNLKASSNPDTHYKSGDEFHMDYVLGYRSGAWAGGVGGYYLKQITDDKVNGKVVNNGNRGEVFAIGPQLSYSAANGSQFIVKWDHETKAENRFKGDKVWFKYVQPF